jgi:hypothetical protein
MLVQGFSNFGLRGLLNLYDLPPMTHGDSKNLSIVTRSMYLQLAVKCSRTVTYKSRNVSPAAATFSESTYTYILNLTDILTCQIPIRFGPHPRGGGGGSRPTVSETMRR